MDIMHLIFSSGDIITGLLGALTDKINNPDMIDTPLIFVGGFLKGIVRGIQKGLKKVNLGKALSFAVPLVATGGLGALGKLSLGGLAKSAVKNALPNIAMSAIAKGKKFGLQDVVGALRDGAISGAMGQIDNATAGRFGQMMGLSEGLQSGNPLAMIGGLMGMGNMMGGGQQPMGGFAPSENPEAQPQTFAMGDMSYGNPEEQMQFAQQRQRRRGRSQPNQPAVGSAPVVPMPTIQGLDNQMWGMSGLPSVYGSGSKELQNPFFDAFRAGLKNRVFGG